MVILVVLVMLMVVMLHLVRGWGEAHRVLVAQVHRVATDGPELH